MFDHFTILRSKGLIFPLYTCFKLLLHAAWASWNDSMENFHLGKAEKKRDSSLQRWNLPQVVAGYKLQRVYDTDGSQPNETEFHHGNGGSCNHHLILVSYLC